MGRNVCGQISTLGLLGFFTKIQGLLVSVVALFVTLGCAPDATQDVASKSYGLEIAILSGNNQIGEADKLVADPFVVLVTAPNGAGVQDVQVNFFELTNSGVLITSPSVVTNENGLAQTNVRTPASFDSTARVRACIATSGECVEFDLSSDAANENLRFEITSTNDNTEVAGQGFGFQVVVKPIGSDLIADSFNDTVDLEWTFITQASWGQVFPTVLPGVYNCTFVSGVCDIPVSVTLTDARQDTVIFMGDGNDGLVDVFAHRIEVLPDTPTQVVITNSLGGPDMGAQVINQNQLFTTDSPDFTFYTAVTDAVGNYVEDPATVSFSASRTEIGDYLSVINGISTALSFERTIPHPTGGYLYADVAGYPQAQSPLITIDPGNPVQMNVIFSGSAPAGVGIDFDLEVVDADGNRVGQQFSGPGVQGYMPIEFTFSNYVTPPMPSAGSIPYFDDHNFYGETVTLAQQFTGGYANSFNERLIFYDATGATPQVDMRLITAGTAFDVYTVTGSHNFSVTMSGARYVNFRNATGDTGESLCRARWVTYSDGLIVDEYPLRDSLYDMLGNSFNSGSRPACPGLSVQAGSGDITIFASLEDEGGNFAQNIVGIFQAESEDLGWSDLVDQLGPVSVVAGSAVFTPTISTDGGVTSRWFNFIPLSGGITLHQNAIANISAGDVVDYELKIVRNSGDPLGDDTVESDQLVDLAVVPVDVLGNQVTGGIYNRTVTISLSAMPGNSPKGTAPTFLTAGTVTINFGNYMPLGGRNVSGPGWEHLFTGLYTPLAGETIMVNITDVADPGRSDTLEWKVIPSRGRSMDLYQDNSFAGGGISITNQNLTYTTDEYHQIYAQVFDWERNPIDVLSTSIDWDEPVVFPIDGNTIRDIVTPATNVRFEGDRPASGILRATYEYSYGAGIVTISAQTGTLDVVPGEPDGIWIDLGLGQHTVVAGVPFSAGVVIQDRKNNVATQINGAVTLNIGVINKGAVTPYGQDQTQPPDGVYTFTNGRHNFAGTPFTFYSADNDGSYEIIVSTGDFDTPPANISGKTPVFEVLHQPFDHLYAYGQDTMVGNSGQIRIEARDIYGNLTTDEPYASKTISFQINSNLGDEDLTSASGMTSLSIGDFSLPNQKVLTGNLNNGDGTVRIRSTKSGDVTYDIFTLSVTGTNNLNDLTFLPSPTISGFRWAPGFEPKSVNSTINPLFPFKVEILDLYNNRIDTNFSNTVELTLSGNVGTLGNYVPPYTMNQGLVEFANLSYTIQDTFTITAFLTANPTFSDSAVVSTQLGSESRTAVVLPGQQFNEGAATITAAVTGAPFGGPAQVNVGTTFTVSLHMADDSFNTKTTYSAASSLISSDPNLQVVDTSGGFVNGIATFDVTPRRQGVHTIAGGVGGVVNHESFSFTVVPGTPDRLVVIPPGQSLNEGALSLGAALAGVAVTQTAGSVFPVTIAATDSFYNKIDTYAHGGITLTINNDALAPPLPSVAMSGGEAVFNVTLYKAQTNHNLTADNAIAPALTATTSEDFSVAGGSATQYIAVFNGQTHNTGRPPGDYAGAVSGTPSTITTDTTLNVAVKAVDNYFNTDPNHSGAVNVATVDDPTDTDPGAGTFTNGVRNIVLSPVTAGANQTITITGTGLSTNIPADYDVNPGVAANLVVLFNNYQTLQQGQTSLAAAISDTSELTVAAGITMPVRVYATDAEFNIRDDDSTTVSLTPSVVNHRILPGATQTFTNGIANFTLETFLVGAGYDIAPSATGYGSPNNSVNYDITLSSGNRLLAILPGQTFSPGHINSDDAAVGTPYDQTQGVNFPFQVTMIATDQFFNQRTAASDSVTLNGTGTNVTSSNPIALTGGNAVYTLHYTSSGTNRTVNGTAGGYSPVTSKQFDVNGTLNDPVLALSDPTTSDTTYIRQRTVSTNITSDATAVRWCLTETAGRPSTGTNLRSACPSGQGPDSGWHTSDPGSFTVSTGDGSKTVYVWTADSANNVNLNSSTDAITLDTDLPDNPTGLTLDNPNDPGTGYSNVLTVSLDVTLDVDSTHYCVIEVPSGTSVGAPLYNSGCTWNTVPPSFPINYNFVSGQGDKDIWVFAKDVAENVSAGGDKYDIVYDTTNPSFPGGPDITGVLGNDDDVADNLLGSTGDPTVQFQAASDTYLKEYVVAIYDGGSLACGAPVTTGSTSYTFSGCGLTDTNSYTVSLMARDYAGNETLADNSGFSFTVDLVAPGAFTITGMTGGAGDTDSDVWLTDGLNDPETTWVDASGEDYYGIEILNGSDTTVCAEVTIAAGSTSFDGFSGCNLADQTLYKAKVIAYDNARNKTEATNSPFVFETTEGIFDFDVVVNTAGNITAGADFTVSLIARRKNDEIATNYTGLKTITWSSNASNNTNICGNPINPNVETPSTSVVFASGQAVSGNFKLKADETGRNITATDSGASKTGTSTDFNVVADSSSCIRIEDAAGGGQTEITSDSIAIDANVALYAAGYDTWGNYTGLQNVTWTGYGDAEFLPVPYASSGATTIVGTKAGSGTVSISGGASNESMSLTVGSGNTSWNASTTDLDGNNVLASANIRAVHYWDVQADAVTAWRTAGTQSWYSESFSATRGGRSDFPTHALLVGTTSGLDIIDSKTNKLFMRFNAASNRAINSDLGSIQAITALNGKIYVAISDQSSVGGLVILDFVNDEIYESTNSVREKSDRNLSQRNLSGTYTTNTTYQVLGDHRLYDLSSQRIGGVDYVAIAEGNGVEVLRASGTTTIYGDATTGLVKTVALATDTMIYYSEENTGLHRKDLTLPLGANFTPDTTYDLSSTPQMPDLAFNDLEVIEGNSNADTGKHQVLLGTSKGLVIVDDHGTPANTAIKLYNISGTGYSGLSGTAGFNSAQSDYLSIPDGGAMSGVTDMTVELRFRATSDPTSTVLYQKGNPTTDGSFGLHFNGSGQLEFWVRHNSTTYSVQSTTSSWSGDNWYHATGVISGSSINLFLDGGEKDTDTSMNFASPVITLSSDAATLGGTSGGSHFNGYIDELRVSDNARYTGPSFTPSGPFSDDGNTLYLYHLNGNLNYSDTGAQQTATVGGGTPHFAYGIYGGSSDAVVALDGVKSGSSSRAMMATSSGRSEISNVHTGSASQANYNSLTLVNCLKVYHVDGISNFDFVTGRSSGGLQLNRE